MRLIDAEIALVPHPRANAALGRGIAPLISLRRNNQNETARQTT
jgi:hypothetical protein